MTYLLASVVGILSSARLTLLVLADSWPPSVWLRMKWDDLTGDNPWAEILRCAWCLPPWVLAVNLAAALLSGLHPVWWIVNVWLAASLVTSWVAIKAGD